MGCNCKRQAIQPPRHVNPVKPKDGEQETHTQTAKNNDSIYKFYEL